MKRFRLNRSDEDLTDDEKIFRDKLLRLINHMFDNNYPIIKEYSSQSTYKLFYEILTGDMLSVFLSKESKDFSNIYRYIGYTNNILYRTLNEFIKGNLLFDYVKFEEYSMASKLKVLDRILTELKTK
jgi:hypothetical protein